MSVPAEMFVPPSGEPSPPAPVLDRRADVDAKHAQVRALLKDLECDGLLLLEPENVAWMTSGLSPRGILSPLDLPAIYLNAEQRWLIARNVDSQRIFDEEIDGLGFQLKEWGWHWGRQQHLIDTIQGRKAACDRPLPDCTMVASQLRALRLALSAYEAAGYRELGKIISHALEATCRTLAQSQSEHEVAGQVAHRLLHRGVDPIAIEVAADGRSRRYRQGGATAAPIQNHCVLVATGRHAGLYATASRAVTFGPPEAAFQKENDAAAKITATYIASTWSDGVPKDILSAGRRIYQISGFEHEWRLCPPGHITGRAPVELPLTPQSTELFRLGWAIQWRASVGAATSCDTYLITAEGPKAVTSMGSNWPQKRIKIQGGSLVRPDLLQR
ncbi:MAG: hypothetical protein K2R98_06425 [Gemmataceae bacterium]|nr:hypothetical protein [Gemmataceae bacterium]